MRDREPRNINGESRIGDKEPKNSYREPRISDCEPRIRDSYHGNSNGND